MTPHAKRKQILIRIRGLLLLVFAAYFYYLQAAQPLYPHWLIASFFTLYLASWVTLAALPDRHYSGLHLQYIVFIFDAAYTLAGIRVMQVAGPSFQVTVLLMILIAAAVRSLKLSVVISIVGCASYALLVMRMPLSATVFQGSEFLALPFLFLVTLLSGYLAEESSHETRQAVELEKSILFHKQKADEAGAKAKQLADYNVMLFERVNFGVIILDRKGEVMVFNQRAEERLGVKAGKVLHMEISRYPALKPFLAPLKKIQEGGESLNCPLEYQVPEGEVTILGLSVSRIADRKGGLMGVFFIFV